MGYGRSLAAGAAACLVVGASSLAQVDGNGGAEGDIAAVSDAWRRMPAISPDGAQIVFSERGDLWRVGVEGGVAIPLTTGEAWEGHPVWSRDGARIAFASDRFGDLDVFVMNADGSDVRRLTVHAASDIPSDFSPDGQHVLFSSARQDSAASSYFPTGALPELYEAPVTGGTPRMVFTNPAEQAKWSPDGAQIVYREEKAYENEWRKFDVSSFARDIWIYDVASGAHRQVTTNSGGDHAPVWSPRGDGLYLLSEVDGAPFNVYSHDLDSGDRTALTTHTVHAARQLSISADGVMAYSYHGEIYVVRAGAAPQPVAITLPVGAMRDAPQPLNLNRGISEFAVSADGKEIAFIARGEVFVTAVDFSATVRVTDTPEQERSVSFAPDGRSLIYAGERDGAWRIYESTLTDDAELRFSAATAWEERVVYAAEAGDAFQPVVSPDGERIAFLENRDAIRVINRDGGDPVTLFTAEQNYSYSDGDIAYAWSPDSQWLAADYIPRGYLFYPDIGIAPADGSAPPRDISLNGYFDGSPVWHHSGDVVMWFTDRYGERSHGSWGGEFDVVAGFLTQDGWDRFNLTEQERALLKEAEENAPQPDGEDAAEGSPSLLDGVLAWVGLGPEPAEDAPFTIDWDGIQDRTTRLTIHSSDLADAALAPDLSALYYLAAFEGGYDLWKSDLHTGGASLLAKLGAGNASLAISQDGDTLFVLADGGLITIAAGHGAVKPIALNAEMTLRADAERSYLFEHAWRQVQDKFYDADMHGVDWDDMRAQYAPKVRGVSNMRDFATLMSEMLGQLNASHTGMYYRGGGDAASDRTASLGVVYDLTATGPGVRIADILPGGPLDKDGLDITAGDRIVAIGEVRLERGANLFALLNRKVGQRLRLTIASDDGSDERVVTVRPYAGGRESQALYNRWIERRRAIVEEASAGRIGYLHIRSMSDSGFRQTFSELFGRNFDKDAVIVDTRFNGGGWLHDELVTLLSGEAYFNLRPRGRVVQGAPEERWSKPSAVVMNEGNYSNSHMFPYAYQLFDIGPLVGMPVPGTATAVWWEQQMTGDLVFGIPQLPVLDQNNQPLENQELQPDILIDNPPADAAAGLDRPLEAAVTALLAELDGAN